MPMVVKKSLIEGLTSSAHSFHAAAGAESLGTALCGLMDLMCLARSCGSRCGTRPFWERGMRSKGVGCELAGLQPSAGPINLPSLFLSWALCGGCHGLSCLRVENDIRSPLSNSLIHTFQKFSGPLLLSLPYELLVLLLGSFELSYPSRTLAWRLLSLPSKLPHSPGV